MSEATLSLQAASLRGRFVDLEPYCDALKVPVQQALDCDADAWNLFGFSGQGEHFESWWASLTAAMRQGGWIAYAIRRRPDGGIVGTTSFLNIKPERQTVEIGATFLVPAVRSGYVNPESKLLMLEHAFAHGTRRVELLTDARNVRSQAAISKLGAVREGVLRRDRVTWTGHVRDSVLYSITDLEWPGVRARLRARLDSFEPGAGLVV
jgi:RimJ/RimL family protein N-acetyltransferase